MARVKSGSGNPAMRGVGSSVILSFVVLIMLASVWYWPNYIQKTRDGEGKYNFDEELSFDINREEDFDLDWHQYGSSGAFMFEYYNQEDDLSYMHSDISILDMPLNGTVDGYAVTVTQVEEGDEPLEDAGDYHLYFKTNITMDEIIDLDITSIDIYLDIKGVTFTEVDLYIADHLAWAEYGFKLGTIKLANLTKIKIDVFDLLQISSFGGAKIIFNFLIPDDEIVEPGSIVVFDSQLYSIKEIKTITMHKLAYVNYFIGTSLIFVGFLMFGSIRLTDIIDWLKTPTKKGGK